MGCCDIILQEQSRHDLSSLLVVSHAFLAFMSVGLVAGSIFIQVFVERKLGELDAEYGVLCSPYVTTVGTLLILVHGAGCKLSWDCRKWKTRERVAPYLGRFLIVWSILSVLLLIGAIFCHTEIKRVHKSVAKGFRSGMLIYTNGTVSNGTVSNGTVSNNVQNQIEISKLIDSLQSKYRCCGYEDHTDWFTVPWINTNGFNMTDPHIKKLVVQLYFNAFYCFHIW